MKFNNALVFFFLVKVFVVEKRIKKKEFVFDTYGKIEEKKIKKHLANKIFGRGLFENLSLTFLYIRESLITGADEVNGENTMKMYILAD